MFIFKKKEIIVDCFTNEPSIYDTCKIDYYKKFFPDWWKQLPSQNSILVPNALGMEINQSTIKRCPGVIGLMTTGMIIPLWSDLKVKVSGDEYAHNFCFTPQYCGDGIERHPENQYGSTFDDYKHAKIISPWLIREKTGVEFLWLSPTWNLVNHLQNFSVVPAVTDFKHQNATHINMFIHKKDNEFFIDCGTPLVHVIPLTDKKLIIKHHLVSNEEYAQLHSRRGVPTKYIGKHNFYKRKSHEQESEQKKCPFGFGE
jgi:hypothetical protein